MIKLLGPEIESKLPRVYDPVKARTEVLPPISTFPLQDAEMILPVMELLREGTRITDGGRLSTVLNGDPSLTGCGTVLKHKETSKQRDAKGDLQEPTPHHEKINISPGIGV